MRVRKISALTLAAAAVGLSLTAYDSTSTPQPGTSIADTSHNTVTSTALPRTASDSHQSSHGSAHGAPSGTPKNASGSAGGGRKPCYLPKGVRPLLQAGLRRGLPGRHHRARHPGNVQREPERRRGRQLHPGRSGPVRHQPDPAGWHGARCSRTSSNSWAWFLPARTHRGPDTNHRTSRPICQPQDRLRT
jgi:hypothetical protein